MRVRLTRGWQAYALAGDESGHNDSFSTEVIRTLLTEVENNRTNVLVILAGYKDKMARLLRADPGLPRRFPNQAHLSDYTPEELADIAETAAQDRFGLTFEPSLKEKLAVHITDHYISQIPKQNGGLAVNMTEEAMGRMAKRVITDGVVSGNATTTLTAADFAIAAETDSEEARRLIEEEIQALVGMAAGKAIFDDMRKRVLYVERGGNKKVLQVCLNMVITGEHSDHMASCNADRCAVLHRESWSREDHTGPTRVSVSACVWCAAEGHFRGEERAGAEGAVRRTVLPSSCGRCGRRHGWM